MKTSLIITTYNWKEALSAVLDSVLYQSILPDEVIIADDGSRDDTKNLINELQKEYPISLIHSWQADIGFRAAESRNRAISKATGDYIIIIDGDIVLPPSFVASHINNAKQGQFIQGGRVLLNKERTDEVLKRHKIPKIWQSGLKNRHNTINCKQLSSMFSKISNSDRSTRSCNMSFWLSDIKKVNGFNNDFVGWGREDSEFVLRLLNSGVNRLYLKFAGAGYHLYHKENSRMSLPKNDQLLKNTISSKSTYCENGLNEIKETK
ncbi:glycosyltransferase family 2 protein [Photobacterium leiognathi]|uniref:glycosyltransferase family 2 protein n=1 Tax=Photobacterium leiognathi TaxID=553611 RepID=UPI002980DEDE|nr:glycosyltransferase family 2 protein [Photobacterium leiognathi]